MTVFLLVPHGEAQLLDVYEAFRTLNRASMEPSLWTCGRVPDGVARAALLGSFGPQASEAGSLFPCAGRPLQSAGGTAIGR